LDVVASSDLDPVDEGLEQGLAGLRGAVGDDVVDRVADLGELVVLRGAAGRAVVEQAV
jgi:hypothetical protein